MPNRRKTMAVNPATARAAASITREVVRQQQVHYANNKAGFVTGARLQTQPVKRSTSTRRTAQTQQSTSMVSNTIGVPAAVGSIVRMAPAAQKGTLIKHSELFGSVVGTSAFTITAYQINPGLADLFPWLTKIAHAYDLYSIRRVTIHYKVLTGTDTEGAIYLGYDPDALDTTPTSKTQLMSFGSSMSGPVWREMSFTLPATSHGTRYVRRGSVANSTLHTYDAGIFYIATENCPVQALGDLYVDYEIELALPHVVSADYGHYRKQYISCAAGTVTESLPLGTLTSVSSGGDSIVDVKTATQASKSVVLPVREADSFNDAGVRKWVIAFDILAIGTVITNIDVASSDASATRTVLNLVNAAGTSYFVRHYWVYTSDPVGTTLTVTFTCTTLTSVNYEVMCTPSEDAVALQT